jgi:hypothetical protein
LLLMRLEADTSDRIKVACFGTFAMDRKYHLRKNVRIN